MSSLLLCDNSSKDDIFQIAYSGKKFKKNFWKILGKLWSFFPRGLKLSTYCVFVHYGYSKWSALYKYPLITSNLYEIKVEISQQVTLSSTLWYLRLFGLRLFGKFDSLVFDSLVPSPLIFHNLFCIIFLRYPLFWLRNIWTAP